MKCRSLVLGVSILVLWTAGVVRAQPFVRLSAGHDVSVPAARSAPVAGPLAILTADPCCPTPGTLDLRAAAWHAQAVPGEGTLAPLAWANPAITNAAGRIAFIAQLADPSRNQGVFVADRYGITPVAVGSGGGGGSGNPGDGSGDPTSIGGTFAGFFGGTFFGPPINDEGDVLFLADVDGGSAPRALFLFEADTGQIVKVAAVGDPSPLGGTLEAVGPGSMNNVREIVFLAKNVGSSNASILRWSAGTLTKHVAVGDAAPGGGTFSLLGGEWLTFSDGTTIPVGRAPDINDAGQVSFFALVQGGLANRGQFLTTGGVHAWAVKAGDATPVGGQFLDFFGPVMSETGEIAFYADVQLGPGSYTGGWFAGTAGSWRKAIAFYDPLAGGQVWGLAVSRSPMRVLDDCGNVLAWCVVRNPDATETDTLVICRPTGEQVVVRQEGDATPLGGAFGILNGWPTMADLDHGVLSASTPGAPGGILNAHFVFSVATFEGTVNTGVGSPAAVLAVNGGTDQVSVGTGEAITVTLDAAPAGPADGKYFFYVWASDAIHPVELAAKGEILGCMVHPTPLHVGLVPQPIRCVMGTGIPSRAGAGVTVIQGPDRVPVSVTRGGGLANPVTLRVQGVVEDDGAGNPLGFSVTNCVTVRVE